MSVGRILVVEDDDSLRRVTQAQLEKSGFQAAAAESVTQALEILAEQATDLVLCDLNLPDASGMELLKRVRSEYPDTTVIMVTAYGTVETAVEAMKGGAYDYLTKPVHPDELRAVVNRVLEHQHLLEEVRVLRTTIDQKYGFENIIGRSSGLLRVLESASRVAPTDATVLIRGETGTGKEVLAKAIHFNSRRRQRPFVIINCGAIPRELLESELFGHIKGSFTGAYTHKKGKVETADGGTVFLDEIAEMPLDLQMRVLRLVQEREIEKVGANAPLKVDVRLIAATHRDLEALVASGGFREDLYYRLAVIPITLPPLRDRTEDIPEFVQEFFRRSRLKHGKPAMEFPASLMPFFVNYRWPGNIRELENVVERIVLLSLSDELSVADLPDCIRQAHEGMDLPALPSTTDALSLEAVEKELIIQALRKFNWNQSQAARHLGISRKTLRYRIAKHGIEFRRSSIDKMSA